MAFTFRINTKKRNLRKRIEDVSNNISDLSTSLETLETDFSSLDTAITNNSNRLDTLEQPE